MESDRIVAESIEATEFPEMSRRYSVMAVPRTVVNDRAVIEGAMPSLCLSRRSSPLSNHRNRTHHRDTEYTEIELNFSFPLCSPCLCGEIYAVAGRACVALFGSQSECGALLRMM